MAADPEHVEPARPLPTHTGTPQRAAVTRQVPGTSSAPSAIPATAPGSGSPVHQPSAAAGVDLGGLLARVLDQQTALLQAHTESMRMQHLLIQHHLGAAQGVGNTPGHPAGHPAGAAPPPGLPPLTPLPAVPPVPPLVPPEPVRPVPQVMPLSPSYPGSAGSGALPAMPPVPAAPGPPQGAHSHAAGADHGVPGAGGRDMDPTEPPPHEAPPHPDPQFDITELEMDFAPAQVDRGDAVAGAAPPLPAHAGAAPQAWQVIEGARGRSADPVRMQPSAQRGHGGQQERPGAASAAASLSSPELSLLKRIAASGVPNLVILFGDHRGKTLHQLAQVDPDALKRLACDARTAEVRLAAKRLVEHLGLNQDRRRQLPPRGRRPVVARGPRERR